MGKCSFGPARKRNPIGLCSFDKKLVHFAEIGSLGRFRARSDFNCHLLRILCLGVFLCVFFSPEAHRLIDDSKLDLSKKIQVPSSAGDERSVRLAETQA